MIREHKNMIKIIIWIKEMFLNLINYCECPFDPEDNPFPQSCDKRIINTDICNECEWRKMYNMQRGEIHNMKHKKEWHTCDRCGAEIKEMPKHKDFVYRKIMPMTEYKIKYGEASGYIMGTEVLSDELIGVEICETVYDKGKQFDLCPKCKKDFERFMKNG